MTLYFIVKYLHVLGALVSLPRTRFRRRWSRRSRF
jgi:hypothetical protein